MYDDYISAAEAFLIFNCIFLFAWKFLKAFFTEVRNFVNFTLCSPTMVCHIGTDELRKCQQISDFGPLILTVLAIFTV